ncbi:MAG: DUF916 and DUF3324 domain-containing protein [Streptococcaceae bacterium]|jgi:hypothetical protein|nr:DUF916 and DUF3324 domain-containing protein [Streptococcaceae bacterium]
MRYLQKIIGLMFVLLMCGLQMIPVHAQESNNFTIQKINLKEDINTDSSYFDLQMKPGDKITLQVAIHNPSKEEIQVKNQVFSAFTNTNGEIEYTKQADDYDSSLKIKMSEIAKVKSSDVVAKVPSVEEKIVSVDIQVPKNALDGVILGSWHFQEENKEAAGEKSQDGMIIKNKYAYALAIKITVNKELDEPNLNLLNITSGTNNYKKAFLATIQNNQAALLTRTKIEAHVTQKGKFETLYQNTMESVNFAPNSNFEFPVYLGEDQMKAGEYTYRVKVVTQDPKDGFTDKTWEWNMDFTVLPQEAKAINNEALNDPIYEKEWMDYLKEYWWVVAIVLVLLLLLIFFLIFRRYY